MPCKSNSTANVSRNRCECPLGMPADRKTLFKPFCQFFVAPSFVDSNGLIHGLLAGITPSIGKTWCLAFTRCGWLKADKMTVIAVLTYVKFLFILGQPQGK